MGYVTSKLKFALGTHWSRASRQEDEMGWVMRVT
jgi:hypothetical protein